MIFCFFKRLYFLSIILFCCSIVSAFCANNNQQAPAITSSNYMQLVHIIRSLSHLPYIAMVDSPDASKISTTAMVAASSSTLKILHELFKDRGAGYRLIYGIYNQPKLWGYFCAVLYDVLRYLGSQEVAVKNQSINSKMRGFKINQTIQLIIEVCLRSFAYARSYQEQDRTLLTQCITEIADWVEIWRLLSRYSTYRNLSSLEANFNISVKKDQKIEQKNSDKTVLVGGTIDSIDGIDFSLDRELLHESSSITTCTV